MNVLIVNASDCVGGAARAAYRLHAALQAVGTDSRMLVQKKSGHEAAVLTGRGRWQRLATEIRPKLDALPVRLYKQKSRTLFSPAWLPFSTTVPMINALNPDIVHLHWVNQGMLRIEDISAIRAPIVWSLHDMWPFTGGCHYDEGCGGFRLRCDDCRVLSSTHGLSEWVLKRKVASYPVSPKLTAVGLSRWIATEAAASRAFEGVRVVNLPNPIDTGMYAPFDKAQARSLLGLPQDKQLILFGAMSVEGDPRKGFRELMDAMQKISRADVELVVFGGAINSNLGKRMHYLRPLQDDVSLRLVYAAADVMVVPSLQENLSNTIMEAMACATPVVAFDIGGNSDMVSHRQNGYLAAPFDMDDLARGVEWVLGTDHAALARHARLTVMENFDQMLVARRYMELYEEVIRLNNGREGAVHAD